MFSHQKVCCIFVADTKTIVMIFISKRWSIAVIATFVHLFLGTVYAWSFFQQPISQHYRWSNSETAWAFSLSIFMLGLTSFWAGKNIEKYGVKKLAVSGGILYALGYVLSFVALQYQVLWLLYLGFGFVGGIGLGLAYVTPVATVSSWFPDKPGLATGMVVMGFGLGAFVMSKILAPLFLTFFENNTAYVFLSVGLLLLVLLPSFAYFLQTAPHKKERNITEKINVIEHILNRNFIFIWMIFMFNIVAGMIFISFQSPLLQDLLKQNGVSDSVVLAQKGATLIAVSALFNGVGRFFWGGLSDKIGRINAFKGLLILELIVFSILLITGNPLVFSIGVCLILLCYGGGFGIIPSLIKERYGSTLMPSLYGITLIAWGVGGIIGPQIVAFLKDHLTSQASFLSFVMAIIMLSIAFFLSLAIKKQS